MKIEQTEAEKTAALAEVKADFRKKQEDLTKSEE